MEIRPLVDSDYDQFVVPMWSSWGYTAPLKDFLPENGTGGYIVFDGEIPVCIGYCYVTNSLVSWVEWVVSNKNYTDRKKRKFALLLLLDTLTNLCKISGYKYVFAVIKNEPLIKLYEQAGYSKASTGTEMFKKIS